jgi:hypothetical protein
MQPHCSSSPISSALKHFSRQGGPIIMMSTHHIGGVGWIAPDFPPSFPLHNRRTRQQSPGDDSLPPYLPSLSLFPIKEERRCLNAPVCRTIEGIQLSTAITRVDNLHQRNLRRQAYPHQSLGQSGKPSSWCYDGNELRSEWVDCAIAFPHLFLLATEESWSYLAMV